MRLAGEAGTNSVFTPDRHAWVAISVDFVPGLVGAELLQTTRSAVRAACPLRTFITCPPNSGAFELRVSIRRLRHCASRQTARGAGASCGGQPCGLTTLRCSPRGGAAKLATRAVPAGVNP